MSNNVWIVQHGISIIAVFTDETAAHTFADTAPRGDATVEQWPSDGPIDGVERRDLGSGVAGLWVVNASWDGTWRNTAAFFDHFARTMLRGDVEFIQLYGGDVQVWGINREQVETAARGEMAVFETRLTNPLTPS